MYSQHGQFSEASYGGNYRFANGPQSNIFAGSFRTPGPSTSSTNDRASFEPAVNTMRDIPVNTFKRQYEPENSMYDIVPKRSKSSADSIDNTAVPLVILQKSCTIELRGIPKWMNTIAQLGSHFSKYGRIMDIKVGYQGDPGAAAVTFSNRAEASIAHRSTAIGFRNGSWSFKAPNTTPNNRVEVFEMPHSEPARKEENEGIQSRKQELLDGCCKEMEALEAILAQCSLRDPLREKKLNMVKQLMSSIENIQGSVSLGVQSQAKQTSDRTGEQRQLEVTGLKPTDQLAQND